MNVMRPPTTSFALSEHQREFATRKVKQGRFASVSEVVRAGMRLLEEQETRLDRLKAEIAGGLESGPPEALDIEQFLRERRKR